jgi:hypothetical protein
MGTEHWALLVSFLAFISSIALPLYLLKQDKKEKLEIEKNKFHQSALSVKSLILTAKLEFLNFEQLKEEKEAKDQIFEALRDFEKEIEELVKKSESTNCIKCYGGINGIYKCLTTIEAGINDNLKLVAFSKEQSNKLINRTENASALN